MADLLTYSLTDLLMFAPETYFRLYELYNAAIWPAHLAALALVLLLIRLTRQPGARRGRLVAVLLALSWAAIAWLFFFRRYADINLAAPWFGAGFALQALLLLGWAVRGRPRFGWYSGGRIGLVLFVFAILVFPFLGPLSGRAWAGIELFGLAPDPTALGTLGLLLMAPGRVRWPLAVLPVLWCAVSGLTYWAMGLAWGVVTPLAGLLAVGALVHRGLRQRG